MVIRCDDGHSKQRKKKSDLREGCAVFILHAVIDPAFVLLMFIHRWVGVQDCYNAQGFLILQ